MAKLLKLRRGTTSQHSSFTGAEGEVTIDTDKDVPVVHDGSTAGGHPVAAEDLANVTSSTIVGRLNAASIPTVNIANGALPTGVTITTNNITDLTIATADIADGAVTGAKIANSTITNDDINSSAAIARTKLANVDVVDDTSPQLGGALQSNGNNITFGDSSGTSDDRLVFGAGSDLQIYHDGNNSHIKDAGTGALSIKGSQVSIDSADGSEYQLKAVENGAVELYHNGTKKVETTSGGISVAGNIAVTGTVGGSLANGVTATTQSASDNSTKVATTAYTDTAVSNLVDSAPGALNTLNELAAAMGDDANFSTTVTNSIATKMPLAGGTFTGDVTTTGDINIDSNSKKLKLGDGQELTIEHNGSQSIISDTAHPVFLKGNQVHIQSSNGNMVSCYQDAQTELFHNEVKRLETSTSGITVTSNVNCGNLFATSAIGLDSTDFLQFTNNTRMDITINGNNEFRFEADGDFHADGDVIAFSTTIASDKNLKENIEVIPNALDKVEALRGVTFDWKRDLTPSAGVIAQEVEAILPEAVKEVTNLKDGGTHLSVNYHALTSILIESIKELSARVKELEAK